MSTISPPKLTQDNHTDISTKLDFSKNLHAVTNKIHATNNIDEIILEVSKDICSLFNVDRLTIYSVSEDKSCIISKVKTGLNSFKDLKLPIANQSIAGFIALSKKVANIKDVYDERELRALSPQLHFQKEVDKRTGYRTKQMLVAPILSSNDELLGVVQLLNSKTNEPFSQAAVDGVNELCQTLAIAFSLLQKAVSIIK